MGGGTLNFDPDVTLAAGFAVARIYADARNSQARLSALYARALGMRSSFMSQIAALTQLEIEALWSRMGFDDLRRELHWTADQLDELRARMHTIRETLVESHAGQMESRIRDELSPHVVLFQANREQIISAERQLLTIGALGPIGACLELMEIVAAALAAALKPGDELSKWLTGLAQSERDLVNLCGGSLDPLWKALTFGQDSFSVWKLMKALRSEKGIGDLLDASPWGAGLDIFWTFFATGDISAHGLVAAIFGEAIQTALYLTPAAPVIAVAQVALAGVAIEGTVGSWAFDALGNAQGGAWGAADKGVGKDWSHVADDAGNAGSMFTAAGGIVYDGVATGAAWWTGSPNPVTSTQFTKDLGNLRNDAVGLGRLGGDWEKAAGATGLDLGTQGVEGALRVVHAPAGIQSSVDGFLTKNVAGFLASF